MSIPIFTSHEMDMKAAKKEHLLFPSRPGIRSTYDCLDFMICLSKEDQDGSSLVRVYKSHHDEDEDYLFAFSTEEKEITEKITKTAKAVFKNLASIRKHPNSESKEVFILN